MPCVLLTGANRGLGLALTREFLFREYRVVATCRKPARAPALQELFTQSLPGQLHVLPLDVTDADSVRETVKAFDELGTPLDVLVNNAGIHPEQGEERLEDLEPEPFLEAYNVNVVGVVRVTRALLPYLRQARQPRVVNISSGAGSISAKNDFKRYCYSASKAALNMVTRAMAHEWEQAGITVVALSPGWVRTDMGGADAELTPEEAAHAIVRAIGRLHVKHTGQFLDRHGRLGVYEW